MQDIPARQAVPERSYPRRLRLDSPHQHGILLGHTREYAPLIGWCRSVLPGNARPLIQVARALVDNAHRHSRSGSPGGTVRVVLDRARLLLPHLYVTDNGPLRGSGIDYPRLERQADGCGLALVERLSVYWDFSWSWDGHRIRELTVQVVLDLTDW
ncbi:ATP-binding protein [Nocardiopsis terrae]